VASEVTRVPGRSSRFGATCRPPPSKASTASKHYGNCSTTGRGWRQPPAPVLKQPEAGLARAINPPTGGLSGAEHLNSYEISHKRHSWLTYLAESGFQPPILMGESRHASLTRLGVYAATFDAVATATAVFDPDRRRRRAAASRVRPLASHTVPALRER